MISYFVNKFILLYYFGRIIAKRILFKLWFWKKIRIGRINFRNNFYLRVLGKGMLSIGDGCFFNNGCSVVALKKIIIGKECLFGENVKIYDHNHRFSKKNINVINQGFITKDVIIGDNVWCGSGVIILAGTHIGNNVVIGAGCVIKGDIPANSIVTTNNGYKINTIVFKS